MRTPSETNEGARSGAPFLILAWAGMAGAAGVALAAAAAHKVESPALATAAMILTIHAAAAVGLASTGMRMPHAKLWAGVTLLMLAAASLFSAEVALFTMTGQHIFPYAAPIGGSLLILSWLIVTGLAVAGWLRNR